MLLLLLLVNFVSGFSLKLMHISLIENIRSSLSHLHGLQLPHSCHLSLPHSSTSLISIVHRNHFVHLYQKDKYSDFKVKFRQAINRWKRVIEAAKSPIPLFNGLELLPSVSDKAKLFSENFSKNSNLDDSGISLPAFPARTSLKLQNISVTP